MKPSDQDLHRFHLRLKYMFITGICCRFTGYREDSVTHRLEKYLNLESFLEKSLKTKYALKSTGKSLKGIEMSLNSSIFLRTTLLIEI